MCTPHTGRYTIQSLSRLDQSLDRKNSSLVLQVTVRVCFCWLCLYHEQRAYVPWAYVPYSVVRLKMYVDAYGYHIICIKPFMQIKTVSKICSYLF